MTLTEQDDDKLAARDFVRHFVRELELDHIVYQEQLDHFGERERDWLQVELEAFGLALQQDEDCRADEYRVVEPIPGGAPALPPSKVKE